MSYATVRDGIIALLRAVQVGGGDLFDDADVDTKYTILDRGSPPYAVIKPVGFRQEGNRSSRVVYLWKVAIELFEDNKDDNVFGNLVTHMDAIIAHLIKYPTLNGVDDVADVALEAPSGPEPVFRIETGEPEMLVQTIVATVTEKVVVQAQ